MLEFIGTSNITNPVWFVFLDVARVAWARAVAWSPTSHWRCPPQVRKTLYTLLLVRTRVHVLSTLPIATFHLLLQACARASAHAWFWEEHAVGLYGKSVDRVDLFLQMGMLFSLTHPHTIHTKKNTQYLSRHTHLLLQACARVGRGNSTRSHWKRSAVMVLTHTYTSAFFIFSIYIFLYFLKKTRPF